VVTVYDAVTDETGDRWLVMEYLRSRSLATVLAEDGALGPVAAAAIGAQLASALAAMHANRMVHRDIKPANVLVTEDGTAKLTDLGIARWAEETRTDSALLGTPGYLAPEVADGRVSGAPADVFSLGATVFAAVEGASPWGDGDTPFRQVRRAAAFELAPARDAGPLTPVLDALLRRLPSARPSAAEAARMLADIAGQPAPEPPKRRFRPPRWVLATGTAALVAAVVAAGVVFWPRADSPTAITAITADTTGDPRTADPCGMFDLDPMRKFGELDLSSGGGPFSDCYLRIRRNGDDEDDVIVVREFLALPDPPDPLRRPEPGRVPLPELTRAVNGDCGRFVTLPDGNVFTVGVTHEHGYPVPLCLVANQALLSALKVINRGQIPRRPQAFPRSSIAWVDACALLDSSNVLVTTLGKDIPGEATFADWECDWIVGPDEVHVAFDRERSPLSADDRQRIPLGDRVAYVQEGTDGWPDACQVEIEYRHTGGGAEERVETVEVYVERTGAEPAANCAEAESLALVVADRLPRIG
jgi:eukaryotic-like serine/threonine-protein kinase